MKKIKFIGIGLLVLFFVAGICLVNEKKEYSYYLAIGDYVSKGYFLENIRVAGFSEKVGKYLVKDKKVNASNIEYLKNNVTSKKLLEMIERDTYIRDDDSIVKLIEKSKYITITLGINDLINQIKYDSNKNKLIYDKEVISHKLEILKHNYHEIVEEIKNINKNVKVLLVGYYPVYGDEEIALEINNVTKEIASENDAYYVDISHIKDKFMYMDNELYLTSYGQEEISRCVIEVINKIN